MNSNLLIGLTFISLGTEYIVLKKLENDNFLIKRNSEKTKKTKSVSKRLILSCLAE